jgi:hypothetical protein
MVEDGSDGSDFLGGEFAHAKAHIGIGHAMPF